MNTDTIALVKSVAKRFLKGFLAGAIASVATITFNTPTTWEELSTTLVMLAFAGITGGITGGVLAIEKWLSWTPQS